MLRATTLCVLSCLLLFGGADRSSGKSYVYNLDETYPINTDGTLYLNTSDAKVTISGEDRGDVHVVVHHLWQISGLSSRGGDDFEMVVQEDGGNLRIHEAETSGLMIMMGSVNETYSVEINAPKTINLRVRGEDDSYRINNFSGELRLDFEDGRAQLREMGGKHFEIGLEDGSVEMSGGSGLLDVYAEDGTVLIEDGAFDEVTGSVDDGELAVTTSLAAKGSYRLKGVDGNIELNVSGGGGEFHLEYADGRTRVGNGFMLVNDDEGYEDYTLEGGDANVRIRVDDGRITLRRR